ncbi:MAG: DUF817 family protein [Pseudomonadota bacterium]
MTASRPVPPPTDRLPASKPARLAALALGFAARQASAALFGILLLALIVLSRAAWPEAPAIARYDALFAAALALQALLIATRLETWDEARVILIFHLTGTAMELFKTAHGSWSYPEPSLIRIEGVPLFTGFMYAAVGSYMARAWRLFDLRLERAPAFWAMAALAVAAYVNFFAHHFIWDLRSALFAAAALLFWRTRLSGGWRAAGHRARFRAPFLMVFLGVALLIWGAENVATASRIWLYPAQLEAWRPVALAKIGSWFLLGLLSFTLVLAVDRRTRIA